MSWNRPRTRSSTGAAAAPIGSVVHRLPQAGHCVASPVRCSPGSGLWQFGQHDGRDDASVVAAHEPVSSSRSEVASASDHVAIAPAGEPASTPSNRPAYSSSLGYLSPEPTEVHLDPDEPAEELRRRARRHPAEIILDAGRRRPPRPRRIAGRRGPDRRCRGAVAPAGPRAAADPWTHPSDVERDARGAAAGRRTRTGTTGRGIRRERTDPSTDGPPGIELISGRASRRRTSSARPPAIARSTHHRVRYWQTHRPSSMEADAVVFGQHAAPTGLPWLSVQTSAFGFGPQQLMDSPVGFPAGDTPAGAAAYGDSTIGPTIDGRYQGRKSHRRSLRLAVSTAAAGRFPPRRPRPSPRPGDHTPAPHIHKFVFVSTWHKLDEQHAH